MSISTWNFNGNDIPPRFTGKSWDDFTVSTPAQRAVFDATREYVHTFPEQRAGGTSLIFSGDHRTGKTLLACIAATCIDAGDFDHAYSVRYTTLSRMIHTITDTMKESSPVGTMDVIESFAKADLLVLDDVNDTSTEDKKLLREVIDLRYQRLLSTLVITRLDPVMLGVVLGSDIEYRLLANGGKLVEFKS